MDNILASQAHQATKSGKRNSLFEFYRFLFAVWVVWYHGYFAFENEYFASGYLAVEFFFLLSGFYLLKTLDKYKNLSFFRGITQMIFDKIKPLGLAFAVGVIFVFWQRLIEGKPVLFGYLWYVPIMLLAFVLIYVLRKLIKSNLAFILSLALVSAICFAVLYVPIVAKLGVARGIGAVSLGVLLSYIPKISLKIKALNINAIITASLFFCVLFLAYLPKNNLICEYLLVFIFIPLLIYFTSTTNVKCKLFDFLGSLSFAIYAYQCVLRIIRMTSSIPRAWYLVILIVLVTADKLIAHLHSKHIQKSKTKSII